jgi:dTMP kinase
MFISFEGIDFSGKSTQIKILEKFLREKGKTVFVVREPGGVELGEKIRELILNHEMTPETELLLFSASRSQLVEEKIRPALQKYDYVISDRYFDSTTVYQGFGRNLNKEFIKSLNAFATKELFPDFTFCLDISVDESLSRRKSSGRAEDRIEREKHDFFEKIRVGYLEIAQNESRIKVINAEKTEKIIHLEILRTLKLIE